jgi:D-alanyl-D-alanine dipeptidase
MIAGIPIEDIGSHKEFRHLSGIEGIGIDLRYASADNFCGRDLYSPYDCAWLHRDAAEALEKAVAWLSEKAPRHRFLILDALRPQRVQQQLWDALSEAERIYLANPIRGSIHSFGMALDLTILGPDGRELDMGTGFDELSEVSHPKYEAQMLAQGRLTEAHICNRELLRGAMHHAGFVGITTEWWHYDCGNRDTVRATFSRVL